jgi:UDP-glucose 4-epimerase
MVCAATPPDPAMFTEDMGPRRNPRSGFSKDAAEIEGYVRGFARRRPDVRVTMLRLANVVGPHVVSPMTSYFRLPVVPTVLGYDARMQFVHQDDLDRVLRHAVLSDIPGTFNIAGDGFLMLSQALRRLQRATMPLPGFAVGQLGSVLRQARLADFSPEQLSFLTFGRGIDTTRMRTELGFEPGYTTAEAFADFASSMPASSRISERAVAGLADLLPDDRPVGASRG